MPDESENIEARLATYIDGEIAPGDRRDIEEYLAANPSHAKLIAELQDQRAKLAGLPREKAPVEIMDHLQQQLERHALLEDDADTAGALRPNRWPQLMAAAAMLVLAAGLGLLVYQVLPGGGRGDHLVLAPNIVQSLSHLPDDATTEPAPGDADLQAVKAVPDQLQTGMNGAAVRQNQQQMSAADANLKQNEIAAGLPPATGPANPPAREFAADRMAKAAGTPVMRGAPDVDRPRDFVEELADNMLKKQALHKDEIAPATHATLTVVSDDPAMSGALVAEYLVQNNITFDAPSVPATAPTTAPANRPAPTTLVVHNVSPERARQVRIAIADQRAGRQQVTLDYAPPAPPAVTTQPARSEAQAIAMDDKAMLPPTTQIAAVDSSPAVPTTTPATSPSSTQPTTRTVAAANEEAGDLWIVISSSTPVTPATQPATVPATMP